MDTMEFGHGSIIKLMLRIFIRYAEIDWKVVCIVPVYNWRGDMNEFDNYRGVSVLNM